jgi:uncharacterized OB-fold protein
MMRLQRCAECGKSQYPPREFCGTCLSDRLAWDSAESMPARVVAKTRLYHSNEPQFRPALPLTIGLVQLETGPIAVCFLVATATVGDVVRVHFRQDGLLEAI